MKLKFRRPLSKTVAAVVVAAVALGGGGYYYKTKVYNQKVLASSQTTVRTAKVRKGNIAVTVSGSGPLYYYRSTSLNSKVNSKITKINFKAGDSVKAGEVIFELDDTDAQNNITTSSSNLSQSYLSSQSAIDDVNSLTVKAPITGTVSNIVANNGDSVQKNGAIFTITDSSKLKLTILFDVNDARSLQVGNTVDVNVTSPAKTIQGKISYISNQVSSGASSSSQSGQGNSTQGSSQTSNSVQGISVDILVDNPGDIIGGVSATAKCGSISSLGTGALNYLNKSVVVSSTGGTVESLNVKDGQRVTAGQVVAKMSNSDVVRAKELADMKNSSSQTQLDNTKKQLDNYKIVAPYDGVISQLNLKVGDSVKSGDALTSLVDTSQLQFDISIDELDIAKIADGQKASITLDALSETSTKPISGEVLKTAFSGTSQNGVTTFPVTIKVNDMLQNLKAGMNANAEVQISSAENVLMVPIESVMKVRGKNYIMVQSDAATVAEMKKNGTYPNIMGGNFGGANQSRNNSSGGSSAGGQTKNSSGNNTQGQTNSNGSSGNGSNQNRSNNSGQSGSSQGGGFFGGNSSGSNSQKNSRTSSTQSYYATAVPVEVELGTNNDTYIEVKSGLKEGDVVVLPPVQTSTSTSTSTTQKGTTGIGGLGGGMTGGFGGGRN